MWSRKCLKILDYQFGIGAGKMIMPNGIIPKRNRTNTKLNLLEPKSKKTLGTFEFSTGQISLSIEGAKQLAKSDDFHECSNYLVFDGQKIRGNTLFRPGIIEYGKSLRPNEQVIILNKTKNSIVATGKLYVSSNYIKHSKIGRVAKIDNKLK